MESLNNNITSKLDISFKYDFFRNLINPSFFKLLLLVCSFSVVGAIFSSTLELQSLLDSFSFVFFSTLIVYSVILLIYTYCEKRRIENREIAYITDTELVYKSGKLNIVIPHENIIRCQLKRKNILNVGEITIYTDTVFFFRSSSVTLSNTDTVLFSHSSSVTLSNIKNFEEVFECIKNIMLKDNDEYDSIEIHPTFIAKFELLKLIIWISFVSIGFVWYRNLFKYSSDEFEDIKVFYYFWMVLIISSLVINFILKKLSYKKTKITISKNFIHKISNRKEMLKINKESPIIEFKQNFLEKRFNLGKVVFTFYDEIRYVRSLFRTPGHWENRTTIEIHNVTTTEKEILESKNLIENNYDLGF